MAGTTGSISTNTSAPDVEYEILCDDVGSFVRSYVRNSNGSITVVDMALDGVTAYVTTGNVGQCSSTSDLSIEILCDDVGPFLRRIIRNSDGSVSVNDLELDGVTPYATTGAVRVCVSSSPSDNEWMEFCDDTGPFLRRIVVDAAGAVTVLDREVDAITVHVVVGAVRICPTSESINVVLLCDDNGSFLRQYKTDATGIVTVSDLNLDGVSTYTPVGDVTLCASAVKPCLTCRS